MYNSPHIPLAVALLLTVGSGAQAQEVQMDIPPGTFAPDPAHTSVLFRVNHVGFSNYTASFSKVDATLEIDPDNPAAATLSATIDTDSLTLTAPPEGFLDMLLSEGWLDAAAHPQMAFQSTDVTLTGDDTASVTGDFTMKGQTHPLTLDVTFNGGYGGMEVYDPQARIGFSARGVLQRSIWGFDVGLPPEGTNFGVGDDVEIIIESELTGPPMTPAN